MVFSVCQNLECRKNKDNISSFHPENPLILIRMQNKKALLIAQMESLPEQINQKPLKIADHSWLTTDLKLKRCLKLRSPKRLFPIHY